ncbi:hypothetical protein BDR26DRAFT_870791 [Obelidium mucronatum]|nr:hypothetical protein BDR26DRAFT_870791 [Obelidium mucronatum]
MQLELQAFPFDFGQQESLMSLSLSAHEHLQSALRLRSALIQSKLSAFQVHLSGIDQTIHQMTAYLNQLSLHISLPFHSQLCNGTQLHDLPTEVLEYICSLLPPRQALKLHSTLDQHLAPHHHQQDFESLGASEMDQMLFHWPSNYQQFYIDRKLKSRISIDWTLKHPGARIPPSIGVLSEIIHLDLSYSGLVGYIPVELFGLTKLESLKLHENALEGPIPEEIGNLVNLKVLNLHSNRIEGEIPRTLSSCKELTYLNLGYNRFQGKIPTEIGKLQRLRQGPIPAEIGALVNLQYLFLQNNRLEGPVPLEISLLENLVACEMKGNKFKVAVNS